jgi:hypothetical protein
MKDAFYNWRPKTDEDDDIQVYQRPWVGLTDEEINEILVNAVHHKWDDRKIVKDIEAKLKEKNT